MPDVSMRDFNLTKYFFFFFLHDLSISIVVVWGLRALQKIEATLPFIQKWVLVLLYTVICFV